MRGMVASEVQDQLVKATVEQFLAEAPPLTGIEAARVELGEDYSGYPAMWLVFRLTPGFTVDQEWARRFNQYAAVIQTRILHGDLGRFPYTRFERAA